MKKLEDLNFSDDYMFWKVMSNPELCRQVLEVILGRRLASVNFTSTPQQMIENAYGGRGIRLDVIAADGKDTHYNIEMQMKRERNLRKRSRYYRGQIDLDLMRRGVDYDALPELRAFLEYLNDPMTAKTTDIKLISSLQKEVEAVKKDSASREEHMKLELLLRERWRDGHEEGREEGAYKKLIEMVRKKKLKGVEADAIAEIFEESPETVAQIYDLIDAHPDKTDDELAAMM